MSDKKLNRFQKTAIRYYTGGEYRNIETAEDIVGDTLAVFVLNELEDVEDLGHAIRRMSKAISDLYAVKSALMVLGKKAA
jgi:hypothetical protein